MTVDDEPKKPIPERDYDDVRIFSALENCILPAENLDETPSMKDGLDRDIELELRIYGCELIQTAGLLLKLPQVAMATGQVLLQRFYYSKSMVKHEVEVLAMAAVFLAAKIEESPRRLRSVINVCHHIKSKMTQKPETPMDFFSNSYFNLKNGIIKAERRILKELGFCVHVKHPHKLIITYLQILDSEKNKNLARMAWNYMNDSLQTDAFVRFPPEKIACACISLSAKKLQINLPMRPPWWILFGCDQDDIDEICLAILRVYARPRRNLAKLDAIVTKAKKRLQALKEAAPASSSSGSFTPSHLASGGSGGNSAGRSSAGRSAATGSKNTSPQEKQTNGKYSSEKERDRSRDRRGGDNRNHSRTNSGQSRPLKRSPSRSPVRQTQQQKRPPNSESDADSSDSEVSGGSESSTERPSRKYAQQRADYEKVNHSNYHRRDNRPKNRGGYHKNQQQKRRRSRSPIRHRSISPVRKDNRNHSDNRPLKLKRPDEKVRR